MKFKVTGRRGLLAAGLAAAVLYLYAVGSHDRAQDAKDAGTSADADNRCRIESTVDGLNVRSAPALADNVVDQLGRGEQADADKVVRNGFRKLADGRWVSAKLVKPLAGRDCG